jgi:phage tail-like protein
MSEALGYLELDLADPQLRLLLDGVVVENGVVRLASVPGSSEPLGPPLDPAAAFAGPAGIAVDDAGNIYLADPAGSRIIRIGACETEGAPLGCVSGPGSDPGMVDTPRGVAVGRRHRLYVADSGNDRVQSFDLATFQLIGVFESIPEPWDLAVDAGGSLYVIAHGTDELLKLDENGVHDELFAQTLAVQPTTPSMPGTVAVAIVDGEERVVVSDPGAATPLLVYATDGTLDDARTSAWNAALEGVLTDATPLGGVAVGAGTLYVGDEATGGILAFSLDGSFLGRATGYSAGSAGLAIDRAGRLLVHPGAGRAARLQPDTPAHSGAFRIGPVALAHPPNTAVAWQRLLAGAHLPGSTHVRLFTLTTDRPAEPPALPEGDEPPLAAATPQDVWRAAPADALDLLVLNEPARYLWIGGRLQSGEGQSPTVDRLRIEHDRDGWLPLLPAIYARDDESRVFLERLLALTESVLEDEAALLDGLPRLFGAASAPDGPGHARWLDWLAGWLAFPLDDRWDPDLRRRAVAGAFELNGKRGTAEGLRELVRLALGIETRVTEPGAHVSLWQLGADGSSLGFTSQLAGGEAQGAVVGTTATFGGSDLLDDDEFGAPLFDELASRFCVHVYESALHDDAALAALRSLIERERPAETESHVCVIGPRARVGSQARVGVDAIVAAGPGRLQLGGIGELGLDSALPPRAAAEPGRLGVEARVGITTRLT